MDFFIKTILLAWVVILFKLANKNSNLKSLLLMIAIPKIIDFLLLTALLEPLKSSAYREWFYIVHSLNDLLMIMLIKYRYIFSALLSYQCVYRKYKSENFFCHLYYCSIILNLLVFGDYFRFWEDNFGMPRSFFYRNSTEIQYFLMSIESVILGYLTWQTISAVKRLKREGLID